MAWDRFVFTVRMAGNRDEFSWGTASIFQFRARARARARARNRSARPTDYEHEQEFLT